MIVTGKEHSLQIKRDKLIAALKAAMRYIGECPCDYDIYPEQLKAWKELQELHPEELIKGCEATEY